MRPDMPVTSLVRSARLPLRPAGALCCCALGGFRCWLVACAALLACARDLPDLADRAGVACTMLKVVESLNARLGELLLRGLDSCARRSSLS
jgi:hypothetical protein